MTVGKPVFLKQMFNILTNVFPDTVTVEGEKCYLKTNFKQWITFELIITDPCLNDNLKLAAILPLCFKKLPSGIDVAVKACMEFYRGDIKKEQSAGNNSQKQLYSFSYDAELIFAAFMSQYKIDLSKSDMHWYKFRALFKGLGGDNKISEVMQLRGMNLSEIKDGETRRKYQELKRFWALPDLRSEGEKQKDIVTAVEGIM